MAENDRRQFMRKLIGEPTFLERRFLHIENILKYMKDIQSKYEGNEIELDDYTLRMNIVHKMISDEVMKALDFINNEREDLRKEYSDSSN